METNRLSPEREKLCIEYAEKNWMFYRDNPNHPRTPAEKKEHVLRGKITEFACKQDLEKWGIVVLPIHEGQGCDDGKDVKTLKGTINVKSVKGPDFDSGYHKKLFKNSWDKGDFYVSYKLYPDLSYQFIGFIDSKTAKSSEPFYLKNLNKNFEELVLKLR